MDAAANGSSTGRRSSDTNSSLRGERSTGKEEKLTSSEGENNTNQASANPDGKDAIVCHKRERCQITKNSTTSPEPQKIETTSEEIHTTYNLPAVKHEFAISNLVWGKVKSHPWWPGVIIDPSDGSNLAMKYQKRDAFLVAYFGDKTFAWCDESQLKPFFPNFSHFEKQVSSDAFCNAVESVLVEVSRRFAVGSICSCLDKKLFAKDVYPKLENAGFRRGFANCAVDREEIVDCFDPKGLVNFTKDLALAPGKAKIDKLGLVMVKSHIKAFYQLMCYSVPPKRWNFRPLEECFKPAVVSSKSDKLPENSIMQVQIPPAAAPPAVSPNVTYTPVELVNVEKSKKKRGRPTKQIQTLLSANLPAATPPAGTPPAGTPAGTLPVATPPAGTPPTVTPPAGTLPFVTSPAATPPKKKRGRPKKQIHTPPAATPPTVTLPAASPPDGTTAVIPSATSSPDGSLPVAMPAAATKRPIIGLEEKRLDECNPTALLLSFGTRYGAAPSEMDLVRIFGRYGPLKECEMGKVEGRTIRVRIVFKRRPDAEMAFGSLRKQNVFGPSLLSYRLVYEVPEKSEQEKKVKVPNAEKHKNFELPEPRESVNFPSVSQGNDVRKIPVDLSSNIKDGGPDRMLVDLPSKIECNEGAQGGDMDETAVDPLSKVENVGADVLSVDAPSNAERAGVEVPLAESVDVAQAGGVDEAPVDPSGNVEDRDADAMLVDPSSTVQVEAFTEMSIKPLSSTAESLVDPPSSMQVDAVTKIPVDHLSTVQGDAVSEILADPPITTIVEAVSESVKPSAIVQGEAVGAVSGKPSSNWMSQRPKSGGKMSNNSSCTRQEDALFEMLIDPSGLGESQEPRTKKLDDSMTPKCGMAPKNSTSAKTSPSSNGSMLLECTPSGSAMRRCNTMPPSLKNSPILESLELFTRTPQQPHFKKLDRYCEEMRHGMGTCEEMRHGMAIGLMLTYSNLVDSIKKLPFDDGVAVFEKKFTCLEMLEDNGFNVDLIWTRLNRLLQIKTDYAGFGLKQATLEKELAKKEIDAMSLLNLIEKIRSDVAKLDEQINALSEQSRMLVVKRDGLLELTVGNGHEISRLKNELSHVNRSQESAREEFDQVLAQPFGRGS